MAGNVVDFLRFRVMDEACHVEEAVREIQLMLSQVTRAGKVSPEGSKAVASAHNLLRDVLHDMKQFRIAVRDLTRMAEASAEASRE